MKKFHQEAKTALNQFYFRGDEIAFLKKNFLKFERLWIIKSLLMQDTLFCLNLG